MLGGRDFAELSGVASKVFDDFLDKERLEFSEPSKLSTT